jgi:hypothetical protein
MPRRKGPRIPDAHSRPGCWPGPMRRALRPGQSVLVPKLGNGSGQLVATRFAGDAAERMIKTRRIATAPSPEISPVPDRPRLTQGASSFAFLPRTPATALSTAAAVKGLSRNAT